MTETTQQTDPPAFPPWIESLYQIVALSLGLLVFLNPLPYLFSLKEICFYLPMGLFLASLAFRRPRLLLKTPLSMVLLLFTAWAAMGMPAALDPGGSLWDFGAHWLRYLMFYYLMVNLFRTPRRLEFLGWTLLVSGLIFCAGIWIGWYVVEGNALDTRLGMTWTRLATALNGLTTVLALILALHHLRRTQSMPWQRVMMAGAVLALVVSLMAQSRSTILGMIVALWVLLVDRRRLLLGLLLVTAVFVAVMPIRRHFFTSGDHYDVRLGLLCFYGEMIKDYPLTGIGFSLDTMRQTSHIDPEVYLPRIPERYRHPPHPYLWPHNLLLDVAVRTGLIGAGLFVMILIQALRIAAGLMRHGRTAYIRDWARCLLAALAMFVVKALFEPVFTHYAETILFTILAMITILWSIDRRLPMDAVLARHRWRLLDTGTEAAGCLTGRRPNHRVET